MKFKLLSIAMLCSIGNSIIASAPQDSKKKAEEQWNLCSKSCGRPNCLTDYYSNPGVRLINDQVCVATYKNCLAKCRIDYKHALKNAEKPVQTAQK